MVYSLSRIRILLPCVKVVMLNQLPFSDNYAILSIPHNFLVVLPLQSRSSSVMLDSCSKNIYFVSLSYHENVFVHFYLIQLRINQVAFLRIDLSLDHNDTTGTCNWPRMVLETKLPHTNLHHQHTQ